MGYICAVIILVICPGVVRRVGTVVEETERLGSAWSSREYSFSKSLSFGDMETMVLTITAS